jgi:uncharacterized protein YkwD
MLRHGLIASFLILIGCSAASPESNDGLGNTAGDGSVATGGSSGARPGTGGSSAAGGAAGLMLSVGGSVSAGATGGSLSTGGATSTGGSAGSSGSQDQGGMTAATGGATGSAGAATGSGGSAGAATANHTNPLSKDLIDAFVTAHNAARASTDLNPPPSPALPPVSWDPILADSAYNYLSKCVVTNGSVGHNADRTTDYQALGGTDSYVGENIYATTGNTVAPADAVNDWMSEASKYDYTKDDLSTAGHYTQVVWRDSVRIGCAIVNCSNARYNNTVLCDYAPGGNITGQKPY